MPYAENYIPRYRRHRPSGQTVVTLNGRDFYLGQHGTQVGKTTYDKLIAEWTANNRRLPSEKDGGILMVELVADFMDHAEQYYRRADGTQTSEVRNFRDALRPLMELYSDLPATEFSPRCLRAVRQKMIDLKWSRRNINHHISRIKMIFRWAVSNDQLPVGIMQALNTVEGLKENRSEARETEPVKPVAEEHVRAIMPYISSQIAAMLELQLLIGMRPGEVARMRACDINMTRDDWLYTPAQHKNTYRGQKLQYWIVNRAKEIISKFLTTNPQAYLFRPCDADAERRERQSRERTTPLSCGNRRGTNRKQNPKKKPGEFYSTIAYHHAIQRGCAKAFPWPELAGRKIKDLSPEELARFKAWTAAHSFHPHQIRHTFATKVREKCGLEATQAAMGHRSVMATQIYAEKSEHLALTVAKTMT